jgi:hypothetical protein
MQHPFFRFEPPACALAGQLIHRYPQACSLERVEATSSELSKISSVRAYGSEGVSLFASDFCFLCPPIQRFAHYEAGNAQNRSVGLGSQAQAEC